MIFVLTRPYEFLVGRDKQIISEKPRILTFIVEIILFVFFVWLFINAEKLHHIFPDGLALMICALTVIFGSVFGSVFGATRKSN